ncbi:hypothetical protein chiPu_0023532 [Chiloscyllium punctatum]|uniref:Uncharacterized protein n=1 Tax=Chiloscyllium punctatum TaxID=137246 RepID=A0A401TAC4_CHIPU|nr:hypothetical protein [Chiloscyllium punctatum]
MLTCPGDLYLFKESFLRLGARAAHALPGYRRPCSVFPPTVTNLQLHPELGLVAAKNAQPPGILEDRHCQDPIGWAEHGLVAARRTPSRDTGGPLLPGSKWLGRARLSGCKARSLLGYWRTAVARIQMVGPSSA